MTPPSIERAVEILTAARAGGDPATAAAIDVVLARLAHVQTREADLDIGDSVRRTVGRRIRRREEEIAASRAIGYADRSYAVRVAMLLHDEGMAKELPDRGEPAIATARAPTALTIAMQEVDRQMERALDEHRNPPTAYRAGGGPAVRAIPDARLREIAAGECGPDWQEGEAMADELLAVRAELSRLAQDCQRWLTESDDRPNLRAAETRVRLLVRGSR